ncbi:hypothetical protein PGIGA_G00095070 [Pangasianodon gigas]|uniref:Uncharacterized protein n=1 Tax=Pangasianodon gigas TaxID=30993 RepID=A0ACC5XD93_PANGG|nr:hypothetical protein [Pangasianodon gigas]
MHAARSQGCFLDGCLHRRRNLDTEGAGAAGPTNNGHLLATSWAAGTSLLSPWTQETARLPNVQAVRGRTAGRARVMVLPVSRRAVVGVPSTSTMTEEACHRARAWMAQPASQGLATGCGGHGSGSVGMGSSGGEIKVRWLSGTLLSLLSLGCAIPSWVRAKPPPPPPFELTTIGCQPCTIGPPRLRAMCTLAVQNTSAEVALSVQHLGSNWDIDRSHSDEGDESDDSDSDNFSVEFEVESIDSDAYSENDEDSVPGEDEVYDTISEEDEDSFDEDTEITEECDEPNPPLPDHCKSCWKVYPGWLPETCSVSENPSNDMCNDTQTNTTCSNTNLEAKVPCAESPTPTLDPDEGVDVPDGKSSRSQSTSCSDSQGLSLCCLQPSTSSTQEKTPELERTTSLNSTKSCLPASCLEPCVICQSRPKNGCIVHRRTGHLMACYVCAKKLKKHNKLCPVCREPIQSVVFTYVS